MKGITEIDEQAALLLVRAYKAAHIAEGPRIRSEVWQEIAHQLNKQNTRNLTVAQWKKRISNIKSLVKLKHDMERRGRAVNWTPIEQEYVRLFPQMDDLNFDSSISSMNKSPELDLDLDEPATMVKTEVDWVEQTVLGGSHSSTSEPQASLDGATSPSLEAEPSGTERSASVPLPPILDLRNILAQMTDTQRKQHMLACLRSFRQQIDLFTDFLEHDLALAGISV
ncbi:unnamed protein product [Bursaphelenchus okinawaensis]|uniref:Regulatory protein zeste n=1 Tax=Bursaphelenchus okinawaensis TaxID=465554 RepID=A0A811KSY6_9BILA|nr:unnamed protein product [Bursaphelenchus okinawaensis]CAG9112768.1 unnamed protein product [Bursaphelenchus okinawaensis]